MDGPGPHSSDVGGDNSVKREFSMRDNPLLQEALDLTDKILRVSIRVELDDALKDDWSRVAYFHLPSRTKH